MSDGDDDDVAMMIEVTYELTMLLVTMYVVMSFILVVTQHQLYAVRNLYFRLFWRKFES